MPKVKRRTYGYIDPNERDISRPKEFNRRPLPKRRSSWLWQIILFPFRLIFWLLSLLWRLFLGRPRLSQRAKQLIVRKAVRLVVGIGVVGILGILIMAGWVSRDLPDPDKLTDRQVAQSTKIYDRTEKHLLYEIFADEKRTMIKLNEIPPHLIHGVIATEDKLFYQHKGIRPLSILRAFVQGVFTSKRIGATSTLTQQLVKNAILTNERTLTRKLKEVILSIRLEQKYTKDQILQIYFNEIPYGSTNYGVEAASQSYFGKHVSDLTLSESATLAGFPKAPSRYLNDDDARKARRDYVLRRMFEEGYISEEEKNNAQQEPTALKRSFANLDDLKAPHFVTYVERQLNEQFGEHAVERGGLTVVTTLDWDKQQIAEKAIADHAKLLEEAGGDNAALVAIDPKTGHILALVGSKKFSDEAINGQFNVAVDGKRQPGSSFKPIIYAAAFEKGYTPETVLYDVLTNFALSGKPYRPLNYDLKEHGPVTMRQALQGSLNIPAVQTFYLVGQQQGIEFAKRLGYSTLSDGDFGLSLVLGGGEVKLLDHVSAYATFAQNGVRHAPSSILKVEAPDGDMLFETKKDKGEKIINEKIAALISDVLSDDGARAYVFGRGGVLTLPDRKVAAKTGTTDNYVDAWTIGFVPSIAAGVWAGNTDNTPMKAGYGGSRVAGQIWNQFMKEAVKNTPAESFPATPGNDAEKPILRGTGGGSVSVRLNRVTGRRATSSTPEHLIIERTYALPHSILHYVNKNDPRGPNPADPALDPQYTIWEAAIQDWIERKKIEDPNWEISFEEPPTEFDDGYSAELLPTLEVVSPASSSTLLSRDISTDIRVSAPRGVAKVTYQLDGKFVGVVTAHPFNLAYYARELQNGVHTLTIAVEDDIGNRRIEEISFLLEAGEEPAGVSWQESSVSLSPNDFPRTFILNHFKLDQIKSITIKKQKEGGDPSIIATITDVSNLFNNQIQVRWGDMPEGGTWTLIAEIMTKDGNVRESGRMTVEVR